MKRIQNHLLMDGISAQNKRPCNMDCVLMKQKSIGEDEISFAVVCDGVGSTKHGEYAALQACKLAGLWLDSLDDTISLGTKLCSEVLSINDCVVSNSISHGLQSAATMTALLVTNDRYYIAHVGDSRAYCFYDERLEQLTKDQSIDGRLTDYIGKKGELNVFYTEGSSKGKTFLVCSDGIYKRVQLPVLEEKLQALQKRSIRRTIKDVLLLALGNGETDNISIVIIKEKGKRE